MAARISPDTVEVLNLRSEIESLREEVYREIAYDRQRITKLEKKKMVDQDVIKRRCDIVVEFLEKHRDRPGITYNEVSDLLDISAERVCQLREVFNEDGRLKIVKRGRRCHVSLL